MPPVYKKLIAAAVTTLILLMPQAAISDLVEERQARQREAQVDIGKDFATSGELRGPLLQIPKRSLTSDGKWRIEGNVVLWPKELTLVGDLVTTERYRGIFKVPVYQGAFDVQGVFAVPEAGAKGEVIEYEWEQARLHFFLSEDYLLAEPAQLEVDGVAAKMTFGDTMLGKSVVSLAAPVPGSRRPGGQDLPFKSRLVLKGANQIHVTPFADQVKATLRSNWASPSFKTGWLPDRHEIGKDGFTAEFSSLVLPSDVDVALSRIEVWTQRAKGFGVGLYDPASHYFQVHRAVKYALLFVVLTFLTFFLFEQVAGLKLHPIQYLTVGAALVLFFLLLLSLSEQFDFALAYLLSAVGVVLLVAGYARSILASTRRSAWLASGLSGLYGFLFVLLQLESYSLVFGSLGLFVLLAAFMFLTRRIDWYGVGLYKAAQDR